MTLYHNMASNQYFCTQTILKRWDPIDTEITSKRLTKPSHFQHALCLLNILQYWKVVNAITFIKENQRVYIRSLSYIAFKKNISQCNRLQMNFNQNICWNQSHITILRHLYILLCNIMVLGSCNFLLKELFVHVMSRYLRGTVSIIVCWMTGIPHRSFSLVTRKNEEMHAHIIRSSHIRCWAW